MEEFKKQKMHYDEKLQFGGNEPSKLRRQFNKGMTAFLVIVASIIFYFAFLRFPIFLAIFGQIFRILKPIIYGLAIAYLLNPIVKFVERHVTSVLNRKINKEAVVHKVSRSISIATALMVAIIAIVTLCNMVLPELYRSIRDLVVTLPGQMNRWVGDVTEMMTRNTTLDKVLTNVLTQGTAMLEEWLENDLLKQTNALMSNLTGGVISLISGIVNIVVGCIVSIYVLFSKEQFASQCKKVTYAALKPNHANMVLHIMQKSNEIFGGFIIGKIIDSLIIGAICFISLSLMNMPYTVLVSVVVGVTNVIPFFGPYIGAIPSIILIMLADPMKGLYFAIFILVLQQVDGNIIGPKILGDSTGVSAFWVVFSILLGGGLFGFVGMIMGVPTFAVLYYIVQMIINQKLEQKNLPMQTEKYGPMSYVNAEGEFVTLSEEIEQEEKGE